MDVVTGLESGRRFVASARSRDLSRLAPAQVAAGAAAVHALEREVAALKLALLAEADRQDAHRSTDAASLTSLVANESGVTRAEATKQIRLAQRIDESPIITCAMGDPGMSPAKAQIITRALDDLPPGLSRAERDRIERDLTQAAKLMSAEQLRLKARRAIEVVDVDRADATESAELTRDEHAQRSASELWIGRPDETTGLVPFGGKTDALTADMLRAVIDAKTSPRRRAIGERQIESGAETDAPAGDVSPRERAGEAFAAIIRRLPTDCYGNHGGVNAALVVTVEETTLRGATDRAGVTEYGTRVSPGQLRQLACEAGIIPMVMNGPSQALDVGRRRRLHSPAQRTVIAQRDQGCAHPGCDRPPGWCETHHAIPWGHGGPTDTKTGVLLCSHHHRRVHQTGAAIRFSPDDGTPEFQIRGQWERNHRYRPRPQPLSAMVAV